MSQIVRGFQAKILSNGLIRDSCKDKGQYESTKDVGKLAVKVETRVLMAGSSARARALLDSKQICKKAEQTASLVVIWLFYT